jgi:hypothetical protein
MNGDDDVGAMLRFVVNGGICLVVYPVLCVVKYLKTG